MFTTVVFERAEPFHRMAAPLRNPWPLTVSVNCAPPAVAVAGFIDEIVGEEALTTENVIAFDVVLVPLGLITVMLAVPMAAIRLAGTVAVNCEELTKVVDSNPPFHTTVAPFAKLLPLAVSVNDAPPIVADVGLKALNTGVFGAPMVNGTAFEVFEPVTTETLAVPAVGISVLDTEACNWVALWKRVTSELPFH